MSNDSVLYAQNVPKGVTSAQLEKAVTGAAKEVSKVTLNERKRFAHVTFSSHEAAEKGLKALKKATVEGQTLEFEWSKPKESSNNKAEFDEANNSTIYIRGLSTKTAEDEVKTAFADYGEIVRAFIVQDKKTKASKGEALIEFKTRASAEKALELNDTELDGQTVTVEFTKSGPRTNNSKGGSSNGSAAKKPAQKRKAESEEEEEKPAKKAKASETPKTATKKESPKKETAAAASTKKETPKKETAAASTKKETPKKETASPAKKETPKKANTPSKAKGKK